MMNLSKKKRKTILIDKKCCFPDCNVVFKGTGKSKYCPEHRDKKYRKIIDANKLYRKNSNVKDSLVNVIIKHNYTSPIEVKKNCECCGKEFSITLYPEIYVYPRYCEDHRNEYKRLFYMKQHNMILELPQKVIENINEELNLELIKELNNDFIY